MDKQLLQENLEKIGYSLYGRYPNEYIYDYKKQRTKWRVLNDRIENDRCDDNVSINFYYKACDIEILDNNCVCIGGKNDRDIFIMFANYEIN